MRNVLIRIFFGIAACLWIEGLGLALRTTSGFAFCGLALFVIGWRFGPSIIQGSFRAELSRAVPNAWLRRYLILFSYFLFAIAGVLALNLGGTLFAYDYQTYEYARQHGYALTPGLDWTVVIALALVMPAIFVAAWSLSSKGTIPPVAESKS